MDRLDDQSRTIAILDIGGVHLGPNQQTASIGHNMALAPTTVADDRNIAPRGWL